MKKVYILLILLLFASCENNNIISQVVVLDEPFLMKFGQSKILHPENLIIGFNEVITDSRCPIGAECVIAGHAEISLLLTVPGTDSTKLNLIIGPGMTKDNTKAHVSTDWAGFIVTFMQLVPHPEIDKRHKISNYEALLNISKIIK